MQSNSHSPSVQPLLTQLALEPVDIAPESEDSRFHFKKCRQAMQGKSITYTHNQRRYNSLAYAAKKHFDTKDKIFFEPIANSFTFEP